MISKTLPGKRQGLGECYHPTSCKLLQYSAGLNTSSDIHDASILVTGSFLTSRVWISLEVHFVFVSHEKLFLCNH